MRRLVSARSLRGLEDCTVLASGLLSLIFARWRAKSREREACALAVGCTPETSIQASSESCPTNCTSIRRPEVWMSFCWESCLSSWVIRPTSLRLLLERARWRSHNRFTISTESLEAASVELLGQIIAHRVGGKAPSVISSVGGSMRFEQPACSASSAIVRTRWLCVLVAVPLVALHPAACAAVGSSGALQWRQTSSSTPCFGEYARC